MSVKSYIRDWLFADVTSDNEALGQILSTRPEIGKAHDALIQDLEEYTANPDELLEELARDPDAYQRMLRDGVVYSSINRKIMGVISQDWVIQPAKDNERSKNIAEFVEFVLANFQPHIDAELNTISSFRAGLKQIADAVAIGYSITEKVWAPINAGKFTGKTGLVALKGKDPKDYRFKLDDYFNVQWVTYIDPVSEVKPLESKKFIILPWMSEYGNPYGTADLKSAYRAWKLKDFAFRLMAVAVERYAIPAVLAKFPTKASKTQQDALVDVLRRMQKDTVIAVPEGFDVTFLENHVTSGSDNFERIIDLCNKEILLAIEGTSMHVLEGKLTGSRNIGLVAADQANLFQWNLTRSLEEIINRQLIPDIIEFNHPGAALPHFQFVDPGDVDKAVDIGIDKELIAMGLPISHEYLYEKYGLEAPKPGETVINAPESSAPPADPLAQLRGNGKVNVQEEISKPRF